MTNKTHRVIFASQRDSADAVENQGAGQTAFKGTLEECRAFLETEEAIEEIAFPGSNIFILDEDWHIVY